MNSSIIKSCMVLVVIFIALFTQIVQAKISKKSQVQYSIKITDASHHLAEVTVLFPLSESDHVDFVMPVWRLGKYNILNLSNGIRDFSVTDAKGHKLDVSKVDKSTWRVKLNKPSKLAISYQLYANQLEKRTRHIDDSHAYLDGASTFIYSPEFIKTALTVTLDVPKGWKSRSGMRRQNKHTFSAENYHILASSPIETGIHEYYTFAADNKNYEVVIWGKGNFDGKRIVNDYKQMVVEHGKMWGGYPFNRYLFIIHSTSGATGATEHINSTVIQRDSTGFSAEKDYNRFLSTSSHEFIHTWNVKAYRPLGIQQYDYTQENYTDMLWIAEGSTSYFSDSLLVRADLLDPETFLKGLAKKVKAYLDRPGRKVMSAQQASFDEWIEGGGDRANNASVSIYSKGNMLSLLIDVELLKATNAETGYAELHKLLYERFPVADRGYSSDDIKQLMSEIAGSNFDEFWTKYIDGVEPINFEQLFLALGLEYSPMEDDNSNTVWTGIKISDSSDDNTIAMVPTDSPAWRADLVAGDVLIAINGMKVESNKLDLLLNGFKPDDEVKVTYFRRNLLKETTMELSEPHPAKMNLTHLDDASNSQKKMYKKWLGVDWPEKDK